MSKRLTSFLLLLVLLTGGVSYASAADLPFTQQDLEYIYSGQNYRDPGEVTSASNACGQTNTVGINKIYMIGDSITEGAETVLQDFLSETGANVVIDGVSSRRLSRGGGPKDGLSVMENSVGSISGSNVVVIALGTNGGVTEANINDALSAARLHANLPDIYWVNVFADNSLRSSNLPYETWNQTITSLSQTKDYGVIDWAGAAKRAVETAEGNGLSIIKDDDLGVHPNDTGNELLGQTIYNAIFSGSSGGSCSTKLTGADNPEKVWNFMIAKGLEPYQVAGFMGNMQAEAGFEPKRVEYAWSDPPHLSDTVPPCANDKCQPGYGIVQWTAASRKDGLRAFADSTGRTIAADPNIPQADLGVQLEYVWTEINGACCGLKSSFRDRYGDVTVLEALKQTETLEDAVDLILRNYEIPGDIDKAQVVRNNFAVTWLARYGSGGN